MPIILLNSGHVLAYILELSHIAIIVFVVVFTLTMGSCLLAICLFVVGSWLLLAITIYTYIAAYLITSDDHALK